MVRNLERIWRVSRTPAGIEGEGIETVGGRVLGMFICFVNMAAAAGRKKNRIYFGRACKYILRQGWNCRGWGKVRILFFIYGKNN